MKCPLDWCGGKVFVYRTTVEDGGRTVMRHRMCDGECVRAWRTKEVELTPEMVEALNSILYPDATNRGATSGKVTKQD